MSDRRHFLQAAAGSLGILGLGRWAWASGLEDEDPRTSLERARALMKERQLWGVLILVPEEPRARRALGEALAALLNEMTPVFGRPAPFEHPEQLALLFHEAVYTCVEARDWSVPEGHDVVLLDERGRKLQTARIEFTRAEGLTGRLRELLCARERSARRAALVGAPKCKIAEIGAVPGQNPYEDPALLEDLQRRAPALGDVLRSAGPELRNQAEIVGSLARSRLSVRYRSLPDPAAPEAPLEEPMREFPFGVRFERGQPIDACPGCGMAMVGYRSRKFVDFLRDGAPR